MSEETISPSLSDHDRLIRIDERTMVMQAQIIKYSDNQTAIEKRLEVLEAWRAHQEGQQSILIRNAAFISTILSSVISAAIVFAVTYTLK